MKDNIPQEVMNKIENYIQAEWYPDFQAKGEQEQSIQTRKDVIFGYSLRDEEVDELKKSIGEWTNQHFRDKKTYKEQLQQKEARIKSLEDALNKINEMSDCGSYEATIIRMKEIAQQLLNKQKQSE